jgi:hypothetical protein
MKKTNGGRIGWLSGWKEIATYLGCSVKTAQDYHKRLKLPVNRLPGPKGKYEKRVAIPSKLDEWLEKQGRAAPRG